MTLVIIIGPAAIIKDHGSGMTPEVQAKVFDPFFTTKTQGRGLGLGLAITFQLVKRNGGTIELSTQKGHGATFTVRFPVPGARPAAPEPAKIAN